MEECIICFEERDNFSFYSCSHKVCDTCYHKINKCPLCQASKIINVVIVQPVNVRVPSMYTTYLAIRCIFVFLTFTIITLYFYRE